MRTLHSVFDLVGNSPPLPSDGARRNRAQRRAALQHCAGENGNHRLREGRWWLVPFWAKEVPKFQLFNAKSEDADAKPSFRDAFKSKRCLIPADGFYEWTISPADKKRDPWYIFLPE
ncbi:SOS response-associated peptidase family protein, partial [Mesorhizobium sp.]|uniref:SOS response-associated peptidase family protein n=1 Tax=Mesorhizobium sp. TaxID=1871066 RepID=UPI00338D7416